MIELFKSTLAGQFNASLCMLNDAIAKCPAEHWDGKIAKYPFWQVVYHTLCFADLYLSPDETQYALRPIHPKGWDEFNEEYPSRRFTQAEMLEYATICRRKADEVFAAETAETLAGPCGHKRHAIPRAELHVYNIRHIMHHIGQLSAYLHRIDVDVAWVRTGWN